MVVGRYVLLSSAPYRKVLWLSTHYRSCSHHNDNDTDPRVVALSQLCVPRCRYGSEPESSRQLILCPVSVITCYGLRFVEQRPVDQSGTGGGLILGVNARAPYLAACDAVAAAPLMDWIMSPSSGQAFIWRTIQDSNLKPIA